ncbi:MAG: TonB-dependent receptor [Saprospiraceae bacterium]|nr:TonB-dependent receptor [Saprospiraceae bacterium]
MRFFVVLFFSLFLQLTLFSQKNYTINGYITEKGSGESLIGVNIFLKNNAKIGTVSNTYGFYSLTIPEGNYEIVFSYIGYNNEIIAVQLSSDQTINVSLGSGITLDEIVISSEDVKRNVQSNEMGTQEMNVETVKKLPALFGEVDILKSLQLMPGISSATEGAAGLYVRGGGPDQNLVLLDEAIVYNTGHLLGFFSVFNSDAIKNTKLIKGSMPAEYGGRISSVIDVQMKEGNDENFELEGGIGLISSRLTVQGPIDKGKSSFIVSGRRTYALDLAQPFIKNTDFAGTNYYFYDLNSKVNYRLSSKDRIYLSTYFGRDVFTFNNNERDFSIKLPYGNGTGTLRWNHVLRKNMFSNFSLIYNNYKFSLTADQDAFQVSVRSGIEDFSCKADIDFYPNTNHHIKGGFRYTYHILTPNLVNASNGEVDFSTKLESKYGHENEIYILDDWKIRSNIGVNYGLRVSNFIQVGPYTSGVNNKKYGSGEFVKSYVVPEPRLVFNYGIDDNQSIKGGVNVSAQYIHLVSNSGTTLPTDIWVPSTERVKPQIGTQYSIGYFRNIFDDKIEFSVETYYKDLKNQLDYRESYVEDFSADVEEEFVSGKGRAYGLELFLAKKKGRINGWIGYTLSRTERSYDQIENGRVFPAVYDRPHDASVVLNYEINKKWQISSVFVYATGRNYTPIKSLFIIDSKPNVEYGPRNSARLKDYHRLDFSLIYANNKNKKFNSSWAFSVYNIYNRKNTFFSFTDIDNDVFSGNAQAKQVNVALFTLIPSITWNFNWNSKKI